MPDESPKGAIRRAYDDLAPTYAAQRRDDVPEPLDYLLDQALDGTDDPRVLDAGCGQGTPVLARIDDAAAGVGLDISRTQLRLARERVPASPLVQGDLAALPFAADAFDAVAAFHSLIHVPLAEHRAVIDEFARVLLRGGYVLLTTGESEWEGTNPNWLDSGVEMRWHIAGWETTVEQLRAAGFAVVREWRLGDDLAADDAAFPVLLARYDG